MKEKTIWLAYSQTDEAAAKKLSDLLDHQMLDVSNDYVANATSKGRELEDVIKEFIAKSDLIIAILSPEMNTKEVGTQLQEAFAKSKPRIGIVLPQSGVTSKLTNFTNPDIARLMQGCIMIDWSQKDSFHILLDSIRKIFAPPPEPPIEAYSGQEPYLFVSYSHRDSVLVYPEINRLHNLGFRIWYDEGIDPGNEWPEEVAMALEMCSFFLVFITSGSVASKNVRNEINFAINHEKPFLAIHAEETILPKGLELRMGDIQAILRWRMKEDRYFRQMEKALPDSLRNGSIKRESLHQFAKDQYESVESSDKRTSINVFTQEPIFIKKKSLSWFMKTTTGPGERSGFGMIYDDEKGGIILDGGFGEENLKDLPEEKRIFNFSGPNLNDTWLWNGSSWQFLHKKRLSFHNHALTFNKTTRQNIIHGGWISGNQRNDATYIMSGDEWIKADANLPLNPGNRESHAMVFDEKRKTVIMFGGLTIKLEFGQFTKANQIALGDTWEFNDSVWTKLHVKSPEPRYGHKMVYDEDNDVIVLFGGFDGSNYFNDTWIWEGNTATWSKINTKNMPSSRCNHAMTYDRVSKKVLLFGGKTLSDVPLNDLWEWDGSEWNLLIEHVEHAPPKPRYGHGFVYDKKRNKTILFGGKGSDETFQDTWEFAY